LFDWLFVEEVAEIFAERLLGNKKPLRLLRGWERCTVTTLKA
jgi:hypothetical protein